MYKIRSVRVTVRGREFIRDVVDHPGSVCVLAVTHEDRIVFVRQYRPGMGRKSLELPGGRRRPGEGPEAAAQRELEAETGLRAKNLKLLGTFYPAPGYSSEKAYCYVAEGLQPGMMQFDASEDLQVEFLPYYGAMRAIKSGEIADARSIIALLRWGEGIYDELGVTP